MAKITINQIAEELNLSRNTISKVLNQKGGVSEKTEQLVLNYAKQMGYRQLDQMNQEEKQETVMNGKSLLLVTSHIPMNQHFGVRALDAFQKKISSEGYRVEISVVTEESDTPWDGR